MIRLSQSWKFLCGNFERTVYASQGTKLMVCSSPPGKLGIYYYKIRCVQITLFGVRWQHTFSTHTKKKAKLSNSTLWIMNNAHQVWFCIFMFLLILILLDILSESSVNWIVVYMFYYNCTILLYFAQATLLVLL